MDITFLRHNDKLCGVYLDNGILLDARPGIGEAIKEAGVNPKTVYLTAMSGDAISGLEELGNLPIGDQNVDPTCKIKQFMVGSKGNRKYAYSVETPTGELVYAPEFDRLEKSRLKNATLAILDPGDRSETGDLAGLSHRAYKARERMTENAGVGTVIWTDNKTLPLYSFPEAAKPVVVAKEKKYKSIDLGAQIDAIIDAFENYEFAIPVATDRMYAVATFDDSIIVCYYKNYYDERSYYKVGYTVNGDNFTFQEPSAWTKVEPQFTYTATKETTLVVQKEEQTGVRHWVAISSSEFRDADGELVSAQAMDFAIAVSKERGYAGDLVWDHYDELPLGPCTSQKRVGKFLVEEGDFYDTAFAQKAADRLEESMPGKYRISIGFKYWEGALSEDGTYYFLDIYHRAVTTHPSNAATSVEVI